MSAPIAHVAVVGSGVSGAVCASALAAAGAAVTVLEAARGPGGRTSQRRETTEDESELRFDHGAAYFTVKSSEAAAIVDSWVSRGIVAHWDVPFASFDRRTGEFSNFEKEGTLKKFVGIPGMSSICKALCQDQGVNAKFGVTVGKIDWIHDRSSWLLTGLDGQVLGNFDGLVASDKNIVSTRFTGVTGKPPPLDLTKFPELLRMVQEIPVRPSFALMLAFSEPLAAVPVKGFSFINSDTLSWAFCDSSKPKRKCALPNGESWVLHSTADYAAAVIAKSGLQKPSHETLCKVADEMLHEFQTSGLHIPRPSFMKAHRWGSAFPSIAVAQEERCLWDRKSKLAICGDFCTSPSVEGAMLSGMQAAAKVLECLAPSSVL